MSHLARRDFLAASTVLCTGVSLAEDRKVAPNEKINVALIGCGGMGRYNLRDFMRLPDFNVVGVCDPDESHIQNAVKEF